MDFGSAVRQQIVILLGAPGTGKGTQSAWLAGELGMQALSTGEMLRSEARHNSELRELLAAGSLVSDEMICSAVGAKLRRDIHGNGVILDGFPRTLAQAKFLDGLLTQLRLPKPLVIHLHVNKEALLERLTTRRQCPECGNVFNLATRPSKAGLFCELDGKKLLQREDDTEQVILRRYSDYLNLVSPLVEFYRTGDYYAIDGNRDPQIVSSELLEIVSGPSAIAA